MSRNSSTGDAGLLEILRFFLRHFWLLFSLSLALGVSVYIGTALMTPVYRSEILLVPVEESGGGSLASLLSGVGGLGRLAGLTGSRTSRKDEALAMLRSRSFVSKFISANNGFSVLFPDSWDDSANTWKSSIKDVPSDQDAYILFTTSIMRVAENKDSGTIAVSMDLNDRFLAAQWADDIISQLNSEFSDRVKAEAQKSLDYLSGELDTASSVGLRQAIHGLIEAQIQVIMLANVREDFVFRVIDPATVQDEDYYVSPRRILLTFFGLALGGLLGLSIAVVRDAIHAARRAEATSKR